MKSSKVEIRALVSSLMILVISGCCFLAMPCYSAELVNIHGVVKDIQTGLPVKNANIAVENSSNGTAADKYGEFSLTVDKKNSITLHVTHICYLEEKVTLDVSSLSSSNVIFIEPKVLQLEEVVMSASLYDKQINELTRSASVLSDVQIEENMQSNMVDVLAAKPEFTQIWEYHSPIILRGMNSKRVVVMKDGARRIGTFPGGYFAQDMNIYESKKVEIIKGAGSVINGSGAISGVINTTSSDLFGSNITSLKLLSGYGSNNNEYLEVVKSSLQREKYGVSLSGKIREADEYHYGDGTEAENSNVIDRDVAFAVGYKFSEKHNMTIRSDYHNSDWGKPTGFNGPNKRFTRIRNKEERYHTALNYTYLPNSLIQSVKLDLYYDSGTRDYYKYKSNIVTGKLSALDLVHYNDNYTGGRIHSIANLSEKNKLTCGTDWYYFLLDNPTDVIDFYNGTSGKLEGYENAGQYDFGLFLNDEIKLLNDLRFIAGIRYDYASVFEGEYLENEEDEATRSALSGNLGLVYSVKEKSFLSFNVGRAFRMPTSEEMFSEVISCKGVKLGNPDLNPEYSWNYDLGFRGNLDNDKLVYDLSLFYNNLDDYICEILDEEHVDIDFTYSNTDAEIMGGEFSCSYRFNNVLKSRNTLFTDIACSYIYGVNLSSDKDDEPLFGIPPFKLLANLKYIWRFNSPWVNCCQMKIGLEHAEAQSRVASIPEGSDAGPWGYIPSDPYTIINAGLGFNSNTLPGYPKLRIIAKNILDNDYQPFGSYISAMGRNIKVNVAWNFNLAN